MNTKKIKLYIWLFGINFFISAFTFGGGYVVITMIRKYFVEKKSLIKEEELMEMSAIAQSSPGAIAINLTALAGYKTAGIIGLVISCIASVLPPILILSVITVYYTAFRDSPVVSAALKGMEAGVAALIVDTVLNMSQVIYKGKQKLLWAMVPSTFIASYIFRVNAFLIILSCIAICLIWNKLSSINNSKYS